MDLSDYSRKGCFGGKFLAIWNWVYPTSDMCFVVWRSVWTSTCPSYQQEALDCLVTSREIWLAFCLQLEKSPASSLTFGISMILSSLYGAQRLYTRSRITQRTVSGEYVVILYISSLQQQKSFVKEYRNIPSNLSDLCLVCRYINALEVSEGNFSKHLEKTVVLRREDELSKALDSHKRESNCETLFYLNIRENQP